METTQDLTQPFVTVSYTCDRNTGQINLTIEYNSPSDTWPDDHERRHFDLVQRILDDSGILGPDSGEICVRVRRAEVESVYYATRVAENLVWRLDSQRQITVSLPSSPSSPVPLPPIQNPPNQA